MFGYIKELFGKKKEIKVSNLPNFRHVPPPRSTRRVEVPVREPSTLRRVYDEPTKEREGSGDFITSMVMMDMLTSTPDVEQHSSHHSDDSSGFDGGFGGGSFSGGGSGSSWDDSSSSYSDSSSSYDSSSDSSSSYDSSSSSSDY